MVVGLGGSAVAGEPRFWNRPNGDRSRAGSPRDAAGRVLRWSWACRHLEASATLELCEPPPTPRAGDVVVVQVRRVGYHTRLTTADNQRLRLFSGDCIVGVLGARYATAAFEGEVDGIEELHLLTGAGMFGTVRTRCHDARNPTEVDHIGHIANHDGAPLNLKDLLFCPAAPASTPPLFLVVGTSMNSGKTTAARKLVKSLLDHGIRVAACKATGSVSHRDLAELRSTGAYDVRDFSDYGFPSTYLSSPRELIGLFHTMVRDAGQAYPDVIVVEIADGVLQRETTMLLGDPTVRACTRGVVLTATCAPSALFGVTRIREFGHRVLGVSGVMTNFPLFVRELREHADVAVASSSVDGDELASLVLEELGEDG